MNPHNPLMKKNDIVKVLEPWFNMETLEEWYIFDSNENLTEMLIYYNKLIPEIVEKLPNQIDWSIVHEHLDEIEDVHEVLKLKRIKNNL